MLGQALTLHRIFCRWRIICRWLISGILCASLFTFIPLQAASIQLSGVEIVTGLFQISPDSHYVIYVAKRNQGDRFGNLYSVPLTGGVPVLLNSAPSIEAISAYAISLDSTQVIYQQGTDLYRVPIAGPANANVKLNIGALPAASQHPFSLSVDGRTVVYRTTDALYRVPLEGPSDTSIKLNIANLPPGASDIASSVSGDFVISPDSQRVIYVASTDAAVFGLYSVPLAGPASDSVLLSTPTASADILWITVSLDSQHVVYLSDQVTDMAFELYSAPIAGPADQTVKLNVPLAGGESVYQYAISGDAARVVYSKGGDLYSVPLAGPAAASVQLNEQVPTARLDSFAISADSRFVVLQVGDLYRVPIAGPAGDITQLTNVMATGRGVREFQISPNSQKVIYTAYATSISALELYSIPLLGSLNSDVKLNRVLATVEQPLSFHINPDSQRVVYEAYQDAADTNELYSVPIAGPASLGEKLTGPVTGGGIRSLHWQLSNDSRHVVYMAGTALYAADNGERMICFSLSPIPVDEATSTAALPFTLDQASVMTVTVDYSVTIDGSTERAVGPSLTAGVLTFTPGETHQTVPLALQQSEFAQNTQAIALTLSNAHNAKLATDRLTWMLIDHRILLPNLKYNYLPVMQFQP